MFIAMEGPDCCGKGTQSEWLAHQLGAKRFKFPDKGTPIGELIYDHLFSRFAAVGALEANAADAPSEQGALFSQGLADPMMFQCMQMANRLEHAREIQDTLMNGQDVVADRYTASGVVYGGSDGLDPEYILGIQGYLPQPDLNILLDIDVSDIKARMEGRGDAADRYENVEKLKDIVSRYRKFWKSMQEREGDDRWVILDARSSKVETGARIIESVKRLSAKIYV